MASFTLYTMITSLITQSLDHQLVITITTKNITNFIWQLNMRISTALNLSCIYLLKVSCEKLAPNVVARDDDKAANNPLSRRHSPIYSSMRIPGFVVPEALALINEIPPEELYQTIAAAKQDCVNKGGDPKMVEQISQEMFLQIMFIQKKCDHLASRLNTEKCKKMSMLMSRAAMSTAYAKAMSEINLSGCDGNGVAPWYLRLFSVIGPSTPRDQYLAALDDDDFYLEKGYSPYNCYDGAVGDITSGFSEHMAYIPVWNATQELQEKGFTLAANASSNQHCVQIWQHADSQTVEHYTASIYRDGTKLYSSKNGQEAHLLVPDLNVLDNLYPNSVVVSELCRPIEATLDPTADRPKKLSQPADEL